MALFLLCKCHSGNCLCSLIDWSRGMATHAHVPVMCMCKVPAKGKGNERQRGDVLLEIQILWDCSCQGYPGHIANPALKKKLGWEIIWKACVLFYHKTAILSRNLYFEKCWAQSQMSNLGWQVRLVLPPPPPIWKMLVLSSVRSIGLSLSLSIRMSVMVKKKHLGHFSDQIMWQNVSAGKSGLIMLSHFLNVSLTLPQALELDKGQDCWWLHVVFPYFPLFTAQWVRRKVHGHPGRMLIRVSPFSEPG